jgi:hypothetical protein
MGEKGPLSLTTCLGRILAAGRKLASPSLAQGLLRIAPRLTTAALAGVVIMFFAWSCERQARRRDTLQAQQAKKQATEEISQLRQQAASALRDAQQSAQAVRALEAQQQQLMREAEGLRQSLESLRQQELARTDEVATLPTSEVASRVASRLGEQGTGNREQVTGNREQVTGNREQVTGNREQVTGNREQVSGAGGQVTGRQALNPLTRPAPPEESASAGHPLPQGGEGQNNPGGEGQNNPGGEGENNPGGDGQKYPAGVSGQKPPALEAQVLAPSTSRPSSPALVLSDQGVRKVEAALIELDSCRQQTQLMGQQVSNCEQQSKLDSTMRDQQAATIAKLNAALADKDKILAASEAAHRAELKAARGTWRAHFIRAVEYFAGGFIAGVMVR